MNDRSTEILKKKLEFCATDAEYPVVARYPKNIMIEVTNACNLKCSMCYNRKMKRKTGFINRDLFIKALDQARDLDIENIALYTTGESFLHPEIFEFISLAKNKGFKYVYITTNGLLLDQERCNKIISSGLDSIKFSVDAGSKAVYERDKPGALWDDLLANIRKLRSIRDASRSNLKIFASFVISDSNFSDLENYNSLFNSLVDQTLYSFVLNHGGLQKNSDSCDFLKSIYLYSQNASRQRLPCSYLWNRFVVTYDGRLSLCCLDFEGRLTYGDISKQTLKECWNSKEMAIFRGQHKGGHFDKIDICRKCNTFRIDIPDVLSYLAARVRDLQQDRACQMEAVDKDE